MRRRCWHSISGLEYLTGSTIPKRELLAKRFFAKLSGYAGIRISTWRFRQIGVGTKFSAWRRLGPALPSGESAQLGLKSL